LTIPQLIPNSKNDKGGRIRKEVCTLEGSIPRKYDNESLKKRLKNILLHSICTQKQKKSPENPVFTRFSGILHIYSHSTVAGGFEVTSYTILLTSLTSLVILEDIRLKVLCDNGVYSQVIKSLVVTARSAIT